MQMPRHWGGAGQNAVLRFGILSVPICKLIAIARIESPGLAPGKGESDVRSNRGHRQPTL